MIDLRPQWVVENFKTFRDTVETLISVLFKSFLAKLIPCFTTSWFRWIQRSYAIFILLTNAWILWSWLNLNEFYIFIYQVLNERESTIRNLNQIFSEHKMENHIDAGADIFEKRQNKQARADTFRTNGLRRRPWRLYPRLQSRR